MAAQQHKIMRQVIEARRCPAADAQRVRTELRDTYYRRLLPLIDRVCSNLSAPGRVHRIERVEIDLGEVSVESIDTALAVRFESSFRRELAAAIGDAPMIDSDLELFSRFISTGTVPWWADLSDSTLLETGLESLIRRDPQTLRRAMHDVGDPERRLGRIARACSDRLLDDLAVVMAPSLLLFPRGRCAAWVSVLESLRPAQRYPVSGTRHLWWEEVLRAAGAGGTAVSDAARFVSAVLTRVAGRLRIDYRTLLADLWRSLDDAALPVEAWVRDVAEGLWRETGGQASETDESHLPQPSTLTGESAREKLVRLFERLDAQSAGVWAPLRAVQDRLPVHLLERAVAAVAASVLGGVDSRANGGDLALSGKAVEALTALVHAAVRQKLIAPELLARLFASLREMAAASKVHESPVESRFSDADEIYVENAGLVILWPFLKAFFTRVGLVEDKAFASPAARQRAVGLLHYLATGESAMQEHLVPLNKVLCGMPIEEVFDFGEPITDAEMEECEDMLAAVIQQATILREMSNGGFRASFLLRKGQISARDGHWLLRVERETHDVVLDRFPWSVHVVKLPWMESLIQVEW